MPLNLSEILNRVKILASSVLKIVKSYYDVLLIGILILFILLGLIIFYRFVYVVINKAPEIPPETTFINENLFNKIKNQIFFQQSRFEKRLNDKISDPFK